MSKVRSTLPYRITAAANGVAELFIYGPIGERWWDDESVTARSIVDQLADITAQTINVRINSVGGAVADALAIHNALRRHDATIAVYVDGWAVSAASLIAMSGDTIEMAENALMMIHAPSSIAFGNAKQMRKAADVLDKFSAAMSASYTRKSGKDGDEMLDLLTDGEDHWYTAAEALDEGFADSIGGAVELDEAAAAGGDLTRFLGRAPAKIAASLRPQSINTPTGGHNMDPKAKKDGGAPTPNNEPTPDNVVDIQDAAARAERTRLAERNREIQARFAGVLERDGIREIVDAALLDPEMSVDAVSKQVLTKLGEGAAPINQGTGTTAGADEADKRREAMSQALLARMGVGSIEGANPFRGRRLNEMARATMEAVGADIKDRSNLDICAMALGAPDIRAAGGQSTSDFPILLENVMHKLVLEGFNAQPSTWDRIAAVGDVSDFREWNRLVPGLLGSLDEVNERGEYKNKNLPDAEGNTNQVKRRGNIIDISPEILVNDDTSYIQRMANGLGRVGARTIDRRTYELLESNPKLKSDGLALFHATHGNLGTAAAPSVDEIDKLRVAMAQQTAPGDDKEYLDIRPQVALANTALEGDLRVIIRSAYDPDTANKLQRNNKVYNLVEDIVSTPRIAAKPWYLFADPNVAPVLEVVFLDGQRAPRIVIDEAFRTGGIRYRVELPFGVGAIDYRGAQKNPGA